MSAKWGHSLIKKKIEIIVLTELVTFFSRNPQKKQFTL